MSSCLIQLDNLAVRRAGRVLLEGFHYQVRAGEITVILGPNGAGKSSLLLAMAGLIPVTGSVRLQGRCLKDYDRMDLADQVAWQGPLPPTEFGLTVRQRLQLAQVDPDVGRLESVARQFGIEQLLERDLGELSSGERQRSELSALMLRDVPVWLLDEPTTHLDLKHQVLCMKMLKAEAARGRGIVVVLHDLQQARSLADYLILMKKDARIHSGDQKSLFNAARLSELFEAPLRQQGSIFVPDYGEHFEEQESEE